MTNPVRMMDADEAEERLRDEYDLLCRGIPSAAEIAAVRSGRVGSGRVGSGRVGKP